MAQTLAPEVASVPVPEPKPEPMPEPKTQQQVNEEFAKSKDFDSPADYVGSVAEESGYKKEGTYGGITYYKNGNKQISYKADTGSWQLKAGGTLFATGKNLAGLSDTLGDMETQHPTVETPPPAAPKPPPQATTAPAPASVPINTGNFKQDAKTIAGKNGFDYKQGNDTYNYFMRPDGTKISVNHKTGDWKIQGPAGTSKGTGIGSLQQKVESLPKGGASAPAASAPTFATAPQAKATPTGSFSVSTHGVPLPHALPSAVQSSLKAYTGSSYRPINDALRTGKNPGSTTGQHIAQIQKAFATVPPLKQEVKVGRKLKFPGLMEMCKLAGLDHPDQLQPGHVIVDKGFVSTSHSDVWSGDVKMNIVLPPGAKAIHLKPISNYKHEDETLLPNNTKFKIKKVETNPYPNASTPGHSNFGKKHWILNVEVVV